jgi:hypothetical protein
MLASGRATRNVLSEMALDPQGSYIGPYSEPVTPAPASKVISSFAMPKSYEAAKASVNKGSGLDANATGASKGIDGSSFLSKIEHLESRGRDYDKYGNILTSPKGAKGRMQVMDKTNLDPGFGVMPARDNSPEERARVGRDYGIAMLKRYGDEKIAAMAYNWGPGNVDKWLSSDRKGKIPSETRQYASNFAEGGIVNLATGGKVKHFMTGNPVIDEYNFGYDSPVDDEFQKRTTPRSSDKIYKEAEKSLDEQAKRRATMSQPKTVKPAARPGISSLRGAGLMTLAPAAIASIYEGLTGPDNAKIPTEADVNPGDLTKEEIELAKRPAFIMPKVRRSDPRPAFNMPIVEGQKPTPITPQASTLAPAPSIAPKEPMTEAQLRMAEDRFRENKQGLFSDATTKIEEKPPAQEKPTKRNAYDEYMDMFKTQQAKLEKRETLGNYMAALQGFLGMMGGTSPYLFTNVGQGASSGITALMNAQKLQGLSERGLNKNMLDLLTAREAGEDRDLTREMYDKRNTAADRLGWSKLVETQEAKRAEHVRNVLKEYKIDQMMLSELERKKAAGTLDKDGLTKLNHYQQVINNATREATQRYSIPKSPYDMPANVSSLVDKYSR